MSKDLVRKIIFFFQTNKPKNFFQTEKWQKFCPYFSRLRRNPGNVNFYLRRYKKTCDVVSNKADMGQLLLWIIHETEISSLTCWILAQNVQIVVATAVTRRLPHKISLRSFLFFALRRTSLQWSTAQH